MLRNTATNSPFALTATFAAHVAAQQGTTPISFALLLRPKGSCLACLETTHQKKDCPNTNTFIAAAHELHADATLRAAFLALFTPDLAQWIRAGFEVAAERLTQEPASFSDSSICACKYCYGYFRVKDHCPRRCPILWGIRALCAKVNDYAMSESRDSATNKDKWLQEEIAHVRTDKRDDPNIKPKDATSGRARAGVDLFTHVPGRRAPPAKPANRRKRNNEVVEAFEARLRAAGSKFPDFAFAQPVNGHAISTKFTAIVSEHQVIIEDSENESYNTIQLLYRIAEHTGLSTADADLQTIIAAIEIEDEVPAARRSIFPAETPSMDLLTENAKRHCVNPLDQVCQNIIACDKPVVIVSILKVNVTVHVHQQDIILAHTKENFVDWAEEYAAQQGASLQEAADSVVCTTHRANPTASLEKLQRLFLARAGQDVDVRYRGQTIPVVVDERGKPVIPASGRWFMDWIAADARDVGLDLAKTLDEVSILPNTYHAAIDLCAKLCAVGRPIVMLQIGNVKIKIVVKPTEIYVLDTKMPIETWFRNFANTTATAPATLVAEARVMDCTAAKTIPKSHTAAIQWVQDARDATDDQEEVMVPVESPVEAVVPRKDWGGKHPANAPKVVHYPPYVNTDVDESEDDDMTTLLTENTRALHAVHETNQQLLAAIRALTAAVASPSKVQSPAKVPLNKPTVWNHFSNSVSS